MSCPNCNEPMTERMRFCPVCGTPSPPPVPQVVSQEGPVRPGQPAAPEYRLNFDIKRLGVGDCIAGVATLVLVVSLFLPWFSVGLPAGEASVVTSSSESGLAAHGWLYPVLLLALAVLSYLVIRAMWQRMRLPLPHWQALVGMTGIMGLITLLCFVDRPSGLSWAYGAYLSLAAVVVAIVGSVLRKGEPDHLGVEPVGVPQVRAQIPSVRVDTAPGTPPERTPTGDLSAAWPERNQAEVLAAEPPRVTTTGTAPVSTPVPLQPPVAEGAAPVVDAPRPATCTQCGAANPVDNLFCNKCGGSLRAAAADSKAPEAVQEQQPAALGDDSTP
jgi:hypothetical protein